jgi:hypothetical protein
MEKNILTSVAERSSCSRLFKVKSYARENLLFEQTSLLDWDLNLEKTDFSRNVGCDCELLPYFFKKIKYPLINFSSFFTIIGKNRTKNYALNFLLSLKNLDFKESKQPLFLLLFPKKGGFMCLYNGTFVFASRNHLFFLIKNLAKKFKRQNFLITLFKLNSAISLENVIFRYFFKYFTVKFFYPFKRSFLFVKKSKKKIRFKKKRLKNKFLLNVYFSRRKVEDSGEHASS